MSTYKAVVRIADNLDGGDLEVTNPASDVILSTIEDATAFDAQAVYSRSAPTVYPLGLWGTREVSSANAQQVDQYITGMDRYVSNHGQNKPLFARSSSGSDTTNDIEITYITLEGVRSTVTANMNGTSEVNLGVSGSMIERISLLDNSTVGRIDVGITGVGVSSDAWLSMGAAVGESQRPQTKVQVGTQYYPVSLTGYASTEARVWIEVNGDTSTGLHVKFYSLVEAVVEGSFHLDLRGMTPVPERHHMVLLAQATAVTSKVTMSLSGFEV